MSKTLIGSALLLGLLSACGETARHLRPPPTIPQPSPSHAEETEAATAEAEAKWFALATLEVEGHPDRTAAVDVLVRQTATGCELVREAPKIEKNKKWSPLPLAIYSKKTGGALSAVFDQTLDFPNAYKRIRTDGVETLVEFVRHHVFRAFVRAEVRRRTENGHSVCKPRMTICPRPRLRLGMYSCDREWKELQKLVVVVDVARHLASMTKPERERDDVTKLKLYTRRLGADGFGVGEVTVDEVNDFHTR